MYWRRLNLHGLVPKWFKLSVAFLNGKNLFFTCSSVLDSVGSLNILESHDFVSVCDCLSQVDDSLLVYMDGSLSNLSSVGCRTGTAVFFENIDLDLGVGVSENEHTDMIVGVTFLFNWYFLLHLGEHFIMVDGGVVSGNSRHFVYDIYYSVCCTYWEVGSGFRFLVGGLLSEIAGLEIVKFVHSLSLAFKSDVWLVCAKHHAYMKKNELILLDGSILISVSGLALGLSAEVVKLFGIANAFGIRFGFCKSCLFFSDVSDSVSVHIVA
ncbi:hypothetical protein G9A89_013376 [Geosiphon pyriformis]|nr:hypothetical protein G9A89_013376 [Geosiphon pyriformis]